LYETAGAVLAFVIGMFWMLARALKRRSARKRATAAANASKAQEAEVPAPAETPAPAPSPKESDPNFEEIRKRVNEEVERNPEAAAEILRTWLAEGAATGNGAAAPAPERSPS
jgi:flagellar biosynthesis/type III secretory pathway M-ring protein FliF/YscJ